MLVSLFRVDVVSLGIPGVLVILIDFPMVLMGFQWFLWVLLILKDSFEFLNAEKKEKKLFCFISKNWIYLELSWLIVVIWTAAIWIVDLIATV